MDCTLFRSSHINKDSTSHINTLFISLSQATPSLSLFSNFLLAQTLLPILDNADADYLDLFIYEYESINQSIRKYESSRLWITCSVYISCPLFIIYLTIFDPLFLPPFPVPIASPSHSLYALASLSCSFDLIGIFFSAIPKAEGIKKWLNTYINIY